MEIDESKVLRIKVDQLWQIAAHDACGKNMGAVAAMYHEIQKLFMQIGKEKHHARKVSKATEVYGHVRK